MTNQIGLNAVLQQKVNDFVAKSRIDSEVIYDRLANREIDDVVVPNHLIRFENHYPYKSATSSDEGGFIALTYDENGCRRDLRINKHSAYQIGSKIGLPPQWVADSLQGVPYAQESVTFALNKYMQNYEGKDNRFLLRNVNGVTRGFLSTSYKRLNTREIFMMFLLTADKLGLPLVGAFEGNARDYLEVLDPRLIEIETPNNGVVAYARGMQLKNADFGEGCLELRSYWKKAICLNGAIGQSYLKEIHLGSRMAQDFIFSIETVNKDTETRALMVRDTMEYAFSLKNFQFEEAQIVEASEKKVDLQNEIERLPKLGVSKSEKQSIEAILMKHDENDGISGNPSMYLFANAVSAYANQIGNQERSRELQQIAGNMIFTKRPAEINELNI